MDRVTQHLLNELRDLETQLDSVEQTTELSYGDAAAGAGVGLAGGAAALRYGLPAYRAGHETVKKNKALQRMEGRSGPTPKYSKKQKKKDFKKAAGKRAKNKFMRDLVKLRKFVRIK